MADLVDQRLDIERDERLILDDQGTGSQLVRNLPPGRIDQVADLVFAGAQDGRDLGCRELLQRCQQKCLARAGGQRLDPAVSRSKTGAGRLPLLVHRHGVPDPDEGVIHSHARIDIPPERGGIGHQRFQHGDDIGVTAILRADKGARETPEKRKMRCNGVRKRIHS